MAFTGQDLQDLDNFLALATEVLPYVQVSRGQADAGTVAMRHDVDHDIEKAHRFASWEAERGYYSTYFILHSADYYVHNRTTTYLYCRHIVEMGHEIGLHNDALCAMDGDVVAAADLIRREKALLEEAVGSYYHLKGIADHGCSPHKNGDIWDHYTPEALGFEYEAYQLQRKANTLISDNQGRWRAPLEFAQTFMLVHPIWWPV